MSAFRIEGPSSFGIVGRVQPREDGESSKAAPLPGPRWRCWALAAAMLLAGLAAWQLGSAGTIQATGLLVTVCGR